MSIAAWRVKTNCGESKKSLLTVIKSNRYEIDG